LLVVQVAESEGREEVLERVDVVVEHLEEVIAHNARIAGLFSEKLCPEKVHLPDKCLNQVQYYY
jgi:hypothetical protein